MSRLRFSRAEAEAEATRLASEYVAGLAGTSTVRCIRAYPDATALRSHNSKHPVAWLVVFKASQPPGVVVDGGELFVAVDLDTGAVAIRE
jgi:hypothetical protein